MTTIQQDHEDAFRALSARNDLRMGSNYIVDAASGLVSIASVWALGGIAFFDHFVPGQPDYMREYLNAAQHPSTLWRPRSPL